MNKYKLLRKKARINIKVAAKKMGISLNSLYKIECGQREPSIYLKVKMSETYDCSMSNL